MDSLDQPPKKRAASWRERLWHPTIVQIGVVTLGFLGVGLLLINELPLFQQLRPIPCPTFTVAEVQLAANLRVPFYPCASHIRSLASNYADTVVSFQARASSETIFASYRDQLPQAGWSECSTATVAGCVSPQTDPPALVFYGSDEVILPGDPTVYRYLITITVSPLDTSGTSQVILRRLLQTMIIVDPTRIP